MSDRVANYLLGELKEQRHAFNMLYEIFLERGQLYGTLIYFMRDRGISEIVVNMDDLKEANNFILNFSPDKDNNILRLELVDNPDKDKDKNE